MCCLKYEQDNYEAVLKRLPRVGKDIVTPDGVGVITEINVIKERVRVRLRQDDDTFDIKEYDIDEVRRPVRETPRPQERKPRRSQNAESAEESAQEENAEEKKRRYPHQKAPKNLSTDQFFEKLRETGGVTPVAGSREHRRRRGGRGRAEGAPQESEAPATEAPKGPDEA